MGSQEVIKIAEASLCWKCAYDYYSPMRKTWGEIKDPIHLSYFFGRNPKVRSLLWC